MLTGTVIGITLSDGAAVSGGDGLGKGSGTLSDGVVGQRMEVGGAGCGLGAVVGSAGGGLLGVVSELGLLLGVEGESAG